MTELSVTTDTGGDPLESVRNEKRKASRIQSDIDHLLNQIQVVDSWQNMNPDSVNVSYDKHDRLGSITLYYEFYDQ